ncbi:MAG: glycosyltransferase family 2 protein [Herpetosiphonaceae bacterium]|nr:glycosyltransferase family 2 protein [Herpetosiphonaceae bacterium]
MRPTVGIVILNWNKADETIGCLEAVEKLAYDSFSVTVVENGSYDDSLQRLKARFPTLDVLALPRNVGYARAVNIGWLAQQSTGVDYLLQIDNDARPAPDMLSRMVAAMEADPQLAIVGPLIYRRDQQAQIAAIGGRMTRRRVVTMAENEPDRGQYAGQERILLDFVFGCGLMARRRVIDELGLFDQRFFLYYEDLDLCIRARQRGYKVACIPAAHLWHQGAVSAQGAHYHKDFFFAQSRIRFFRKHLNRRNYWLFALAEARYLASILLRRLARGDTSGARAYGEGAIRELFRTTPITDNR